MIYLELSPPIEERGRGGGEEEKEKEGQEKSRNLTTPHRRGGEKYKVMCPPSPARSRLAEF